MMKIIFIVVGWIFINIIIKLFVNSIERIFKDKIDDFVIVTPNYLKFISIEIIRYIFIIIITPTIIFFNIILFVKQIRLIRYLLSDLQTIYSLKKFHQRVPFMEFLIKHPLSLISMNKQKKVITEWLNKNDITYE